jgi:hypothetical protein
VLADAIDSISMVWLLTWDMYNRLQEKADERAKEIKKKGGKIVTN